MYTAAFEDTLNQCLQKENRLPETWIMVGGMQEDEIKGFYQLCDAEPVENETKRSPWLTTLFVEPDLRGWHYGELLMNHARYEAGKLGFDKMYLATDHIGFYEKYGFREIGLERFAWGRPTKIYETDTFGKVQLAVYDEKNLPGDETYLKVAAYKGGYTPGENGAMALHFEKYFAPPDCFAKKWFTILAFRGDELIGRINFIRSSTDVRHWYLGDLSVKSTERRKRIASRMLQRGSTEFGKMEMVTSIFVPILRKTIPRRFVSIRNSDLQIQENVSLLRILCLEKMKRHTE